MRENFLSVIYLWKYFAERILQGKEAIMDQIKKTLSEQHACYVLITCSDPSKEGKMDVEMHFDGDETLAAYLVDNAQQVFHQEDRKSK